MKTTQFLGNLLCLASLATQPVHAIVGGSDASADSAPFMVSVISKSAFGDTHICGGSLISSKSVLTSAYCTASSTASSLDVRLGSLQHGSGGTLNHVTKLIFYPNYNANTEDSDYAILHLQDAVTDILPAVVSKEQPASGAPLTLYGWGSTAKDSKRISKTLQQLETTFITGDDCSSLWSDVNPITQNMNCDAAPEKNKGSCKKDAGGPVVNEYGEIVGIMGKYNYCQKDSNGRPDVNAATFNHISWIDQNTI